MDTEKHDHQEHGELARRVQQEGNQADGKPDQLH